MERKRGAIKGGEIGRMRSEKVRGNKGWYVGLAKGDKGGEIRSGRK